MGFAWAMMTMMMVTEGPVWMMEGFNEMRVMNMYVRANGHSSVCSSFFHRDGPIIICTGSSEGNRLMLTLRNILQIRTKDRNL